MNADHIVANSEDAMGLTGELDALAIVERYSNYIDCYRLMTKTADDAYGALLDFFGRARPRYMWTDSSPELIRAIKDIRVPHGNAVPSRTRTLHLVNAGFARLWRAHVRSSNTQGFQVASGALRFGSGASHTTRRWSRVTHHGTCDTTRGISIGKR